MTDPVNDPQTEGTDAATAVEQPARAWRGPDPVALLVGLLTLGMALAALVGQLPDLSGFDPRWVLAGGAALLGVVLLAGSLRSRRRT